MCNDAADMTAYLVPLVGIAVGPPDAVGSCSAVHAEPREHGCRANDSAEGNAGPNREQKNQPPGDEVAGSPGRDRQIVDVAARPVPVPQLERAD
jgi:hypothetical protein